MPERFAADEQLRHKVDELLAAVVDALREEMLRLAASGGVDVDAYPDGFALPRVLLAPAMARVSLRLGPRTAEHKADAGNLRHF